MTAESQQTKPIWADRSVALIQLVSILLLPGALLTSASETEFVRRCPSQYGPLVLALLLAGLISAAISNAASLTYDFRSPFARLLALCSLVPISGIAYWLTSEAPEDGPFDTLAAWALAMSFFTAAASCVEAMPWKIATERRRQMFLLIDLPFLLVCVAVVVFKYQYFDWGTDAFIQVVSESFPRPPYRTPASEETQRQTLSMVRSVFWIGFSTGVVTTQLIVAQVSSAIVRLRYQGQD